VDPVLKDRIWQPATEKLRTSNKSGVHWQYVHVERTRVLQGRCQPSLLYGLLFHWRLGYRVEHLTAGRSVLGVPSAAHSALPHHQLHERVFHLQEYSSHHVATIQVTWQLNNLGLAIWPWLFVFRLHQVVFRVNPTAKKGSSWTDTACTSKTKGAAQRDAQNSWRRGNFWFQNMSKTDPIYKSAYCHYRVYYKSPPAHILSHMNPIQISGSYSYNTDFHEACARISWEGSSGFWANSQNCEKQLLVSSRLSVCLSACNNSAQTGRIFMKFDIWVFFEKLSKKFKVSLKSDKNNRYFTWSPVYIFDHTSLSSS
jgi:hypothetical protein